MLLKIGEEAELSEVVMARAARQLLYVKSIEAEDLYDAFEKVRPYGRIFHDNLFKHASETVKKVMDDFKPKLKELQSKGKPNDELNEFLAQRPTKQKSGFAGDALIKIKTADWMKLKLKNSALF